MSDRRVHVRYTKWDGSLHWHFDATVIDRDSYGTWLLVEPGATYRRGAEAPRVDEHGFVVLVPPDGWWTAYFNAVPRAQHGHLVYVDINTVPRWDADTVHLIDLDLDVVMAADRSVAIVDRDEFEVHQVHYSYPSDIIGGTEGAAQEISDLITRGTEPFALAGSAQVAKHLSWAAGMVVDGHGVASGAAADPRFPDGTLALQFPHFRAAGVPLDDWVQATINVDLPFPLEPHAPRHRIADLEWLEGYPAETFEFFTARIAHRGVVHPALIYRPDPATKPEFDQPTHVVEVLAPRLEGVAQGTPLSVWIDPRESGFVV